MSDGDDAEIESLSSEVVRQLERVWREQRRQADRIEHLERQIGLIDESLVDFRRIMATSLTGLSQRVIASEEVMTSHGRRLTTLEQQVAGLTGHADLADERLHTLTGRALSLIAAGVLALNLAIAIAAVALVVLAWRTV